MDLPGNIGTGAVASEHTMNGEAAVTDPARILCQCGQHVLSDGDSGSSIELLDESELDWQSVFELAQEHRMELLLFRLLKNQPREACPTSLYETLKRRLRTVQTNNLSMAAELVSLVETFQTNGVKILPYKGPVIASRAYGDVSLRRFVDLDLLVSPADRQSAINLLREQGYEQRQVKKHLFETVLKRPNDSVYIDLHTRLVPRYFPYQFSFSRLYDRRAMVDIGGQSVPSLSSTDAILAHSIHGSKHHWFRAEWILATAALLQRVTDPSKLFHRAVSMGCERMVLLALVLSRRLFDASFSSALEQRLAEFSRSMNTVRTAADEILERLFTRESMNKWNDKEMHLADFRLRSRLHSGVKMKLQFWTNALTQPRPEDRESIDLPARLSPLYRVIRPARLLYAHRNSILEHTVKK